MEDSLPDPETRWHSELSAAEPRRAERDPLSAHARFRALGAQHLIEIEKSPGKISEKQTSSAKKKASLFFERQDGEQNKYAFQLLEADGPV